MRNSIALVILAAALLVGCGRSRPVYSPAQYETALTLYLHNESLDNIAVKLALDDTGEARAVVRAGLRQLNHRYNNE